VAVLERTKNILWARSAGRCQYRGCNKSLIGDLVAKHQTLNTGYVAHNIAESPGGPRGDAVLSPALADDVANLLLLCDAHHRLIDRDARAEHPQDILLAMKAEHEDRIEWATSIDNSRATRVLLFGARIGAHGYPVSREMSRQALLSDFRFSDKSPIELTHSGSAFDDNEQEYWSAEPVNLRRQFNARVRQLLEDGEVGHLSLFALAPQPLLILLGHLMSDIPSVEVFQLHREPQDWRWRDGPATEFKIVEVPRTGKQVALKLALSATVTDDRICRVLGPQASIWSITVEDPNNNMMQARESLAAFKATARKVLDQIKAKHGEDATIHVFPVMPVSAAVEFGRIRMPKADLPMVLYDQNSALDGFVPRLSLPEDTMKAPNL
jgi:hypothetical protein